MFYKTTTFPPQVRFRCRNPRCGTKLKTPTDNPKDAFCCRGCEVQHYGRHCRVCETVISPQKTKPRAVCWRSRCRHELQRHPERYKAGLGQISSKTGAATPTAGLGQISSGSAQTTGLESGLKSGRAWRVIAGPGASLDPINLRVDPGTLPRTHGDPVIFKRNTPPLNIVGGYRFPGAPAISLIQRVRP